MADKHLKRVVGVPGAILLGLGSIVGTGVFVSIGIAAGVAGSGVVAAVFAASLVAVCNGLSSAQLAANHPVSGGTYEYGYRYLTPQLGFIAGWLFLLAKSASAATAALGFAAYLVGSLGLPQAGYQPIATGSVVLLTLVVASGMSRSNRMNTLIVGVTLIALLAFALSGLPQALENGRQHLDLDLLTLFGQSSFLEAVALMFVAYTGYGRIATLGEEIVAPGKNIPRAMIATLLSSMLLYFSVAAVTVAAVGAPALAQATLGVAAPLEVVAEEFGVPGLNHLIAVGAITAMLGVLLNLILGLSRVLFAMARRSDMPPALAKVQAGSPRRSVYVIGLAIAGLTLAGDVRLTWAFSAFTVLCYYALTNLAALRLKASERLFPRWISVGGLISCAGLAFWVESRVFWFGLGAIGLGLAWQWLVRRVWAG